MLTPGPQYVFAVSSDVGYLYWIKDSQFSQNLEEAYVGSMKDISGLIEQACSGECLEIEMVQIRKIKEKK